MTSNGGAGKCKLVLAGAARAMAMLGTPVHVNIGNPTDFTKQGIVSPGAAIVESTGTIVWTFYQSGIAGASGAAFDIADNDEVHATLYVDR